MTNRTTTALLCLLLSPALATGQGVFVPDPTPPQLRHEPLPLVVETSLLQVRTTIQDGTATTELQQTLHNRSNVVQEATWLLPLPAGAAADRFTMTVNGVETPGEVLNAGQARSIYEQIVRQRRDPGLLEYLGSGMLRARVFPIPPQGEVLVKVRYAELLPHSSGITTWRFPLRAAFADGRGPQKLSLLATITAQTPIKTVFSPLLGLDIVRDGDHKARASFECAAGQMPQRDLALHYGLGEQDFGVHLLTHQRPGLPDGTFVLLLAPKRDWPVQPGIARCLHLVLDTSGSMAGEKIQQARGAVRQFLHSLAADDCFNVIPFSTEARPFFPAPVRASKDNVQQALARVDALEARGGTNIDEALQLALQQALPPDGAAGAGQPALVPITVFLTDGQPTVGRTDIDGLLGQAQQHNKHKARVFVFGVGHDVNTRLLDALAEQSRGDRDYVQPGEDIELKTGALFHKLSGPVMTDVRLVLDGIEVLDQQPHHLPDLFRSGQLVVVGRYRGQGHKAIRLCGRVGDKEREYVFEGTFGKDGAANDWLPSLWAQRKVAALLDAIRINGQKQELVDEVVRLGKEFGIVTPFTSHLILEEADRVARNRGIDPGTPLPAVDAGTIERLHGEWTRSGVPAAGQPTAPADLPGLAEAAKAEGGRARTALESKPAETGDRAVFFSSALGALRADDKLARRDGAVALTFCRVGERTFHLVAGVWVDAGYTAAMADKVQRIEPFSAAWFALANARPHLVQALAFSTRIVIVDGDAVFEIG